MIETITPAGCGSRNRQIIALAGFTLGAILAAAALGWALGAAGAALDPAWALPVAGVLALLGAAREGLARRVPLPQLRRQVPERWRRTLPLPFWSVGYGAGLGLGFLTHQVVATYWVVCAGALALGEPAVGALALGLFGGGRALMVIVPSLAPEGPPAAVAAMVRGHRAVGAVNAVVLTLLGALLVATPAVAAEPAGGTGQLDPSPSGTTLAWTQLSGATSEVVVKARSRPAVSFPDARQPALNGPLLAYATTGGIAVVRWETGARVATVGGVLEKPALAWPWIAYVRRGGSRSTLELRSLTTGRVRTVASASRLDDLGRPALKAGRIAYHFTTGRRSEIIIRPIRRLGRASLVASSRTGIHVNPALSRTHVAWVEQRGVRSYLRLRPIAGGHVRTLTSIGGGDRIFWTTGLSESRAYVTRWRLVGRRAGIQSVAWRR
jgi:hypothetical protein